MIKARGWNKGNDNSENEGEQRVGGCLQKRAVLVEEYFGVEV